MKFIKEFKDLNKKDVKIAGGKGASLGEMYSSKIPVPNGFVILSNAFQDFIYKTGLISEIESELNKVNIKNIETVEKASENIRSMIFLKDFPKEFKKEIYSKFDSLNSKYVAVRSSATSEDSTDAAWAGQLDTYINTTKDNLIENIQKCWASLFTPRAIFYRFEKGLNKIEVPVAVVIQKMVQSEISGIAFSVHPVTEDNNQILIEAGYGLGEAIVSGSVTPDNYIIKKDSSEIESKNINKQNKALYKAKRGGMKWEKIGIKKSNQQKLPDKLIKRLTKIIIQIENHYNFPCDIEWAYEKGKLFITQSRPITTLKKGKSKEKSIVDMFLNTILGREIFQCLDTNIFPETVVWTKRQFLKDHYKDKTPLPFIILMKGKQSVAYYLDEKWDSIGAEFTKNYLTNKKSAKDAIKEFQSNIKEMDKLYSKYTYDYIKGKNLQELQRLMPKLMALMEPKFFPVTDKDFCKKYLPKLSTKKINEIWKKGIEPTCESFDRRQERTAYNEIIKGKSLLELKEKFQYFYTGLTTVLNLDKTEKRLNKEYSLSPSKAKLKLLELNKKKINNKFNTWYKSINTKQKFMVNFIQKMIEFRDLRKDVHTQGITLFYRIALLKIFNPLKIPEEYIQFVSYDELLKPLSYFKNKEEEIINRKKGYGLFIEDNGNNIPGFINFSDSKKILDKYIDNLKDNSDNITGMSASKGKIIGKVRVITSIGEQSKYFKKGEILVTGMTRPEYMPLAKISSAIVTDEGGVTCHAAIISRELSTPCIVGTDNATRMLKTGDLVEVDANNGVVKILKKAE